MYSKCVMIQNPTGLHARPAADLIAMTHNYESVIAIVNGDDTIDPRSVFSLLAGNLKAGTTVTVQAEGKDEVACVEAICTYIEALEE